MSKDSISSKLQELFELYQSGTITKEEYELLKSELINGNNKQASETIDENQEPDNPELNTGSKSVETTNDDGIKEVDNNPVKDEEENPEVDSKPEIKPKKQKPIGILIIIVAVVISLVVVGISLNWFSDNKLSKQKDENQDFSFDYEVYDTSTDKNAPYLNVRSTPHSESTILIKLKDGDKVSVLESGIGENNKWFKIMSQNNKSIGYVHERYIRKIGSINEGSNIAAAQSAGIETFLKVFFKDFLNKGNNTKITVHPNIGIQILKNPGAICYANNSQEIEQVDLQIVEPKLVNRKLHGGFCTEFTNSVDGIYYSKIRHEELPTFGHYGQESDDMIIKNVTIPSGYGSIGEIQEVFVLKDEYITIAFYFARIGGKWYLICQDFCDCSA